MSKTKKKKSKKHKKKQQKTPLMDFGTIISGVLVDLKNFSKRY